MAGRLFGVLCIVSLWYGIVSGNGAALTGAILSGAEKTVELVLFLVGSMALWSGVLSVLREAGAVRGLSRLMSPLLRFAFPGIGNEGIGAEIREDIASCISANLLGIGNAATPFALAALEKMRSLDPSDERPSAEMVTLTVLNTAPFCLLPTTIIALRQEAGSTSPFSVLVPIWIASFATAAFGMLLTVLAGRAERAYARKKTWAAERRVHA